MTCAGFNSKIGILVEASVNFRLKILDSLKRRENYPGFSKSVRYTVYRIRYKEGHIRFDTVALLKL